MIWAIDIETTGLGAGDEILTVALKSAERHIVLNAPFSEGALEALIELFESDAVFVAHNAVFDFGRVSKLGLPIPRKIWCTLQMARLLHPDQTKSYALFGVAESLGIPIDEEHRRMKARNRAEIKQAIGQASLFEHDPYLERYALLDAELSLKIYEAQQALVTDSNKELVDFEMRAVRTYARLTARGICIDEDYAEELLGKTREELQSVLAALDRDGLSEPNKRGAVREYIVKKGVKLPDYHPSSLVFTAKAHQELKPLFDKGKPITVTIEHLSFGAEAIEELTREVPELASLKRYNELRFYEGQLENLLESACEGRLHPLYNFTLAGRRATEHPQLQNLNMEYMRGVLIGSPNRDATLLEFDLSNAENWMAAMMSADSIFAAACASGDFHTSMAKVYFPGEFAVAEQAGDTAKMKELRQKGKGITFGMAYGMGAQTMATRLKIPLERAKKILEQVAMSFPALTAAKRAAKDAYEQRGYTVLWSGRKIVGGSAKDAWNYICQGGVAEITKRAAVLIDEFLTDNGYKSYLALDIHDALIIVVHHDEAASIVDRIAELIEGVVPQWWNQRTMPNVRWIARPDFDKNAEKWGYRQLDLRLALQGQHAAKTDSESGKGVSAQFDVARFLVKPVQREVVLGYPMFNIAARPIKTLQDSVTLFKELDAAIEGMADELIALPIPNSSEWRYFKRDQARVLAETWLTHYAHFRNPEMPIEFFRAVIKRLDDQERVAKVRRRKRAEYEEKAAGYEAEVAEIIKLSGVAPNDDHLQ
jgi:DNA polymerase I-like protein with 3'-5' exonuclease and polymerase domains